MYVQLDAEPRTLAAAVDAALTTDEKALTVGLDAIPGLDDGVMNALIVALRRMRDGGGTVRLHVTRPDVASALEVAGLDKVFEVVAAPEGPRPKAAGRRKGAGGVRKTAGGLAAIFAAFLVFGEFARAAIGTTLR
jgi:anti-anti-sigma regulatory factor